MTMSDRVGSEIRNPRHAALDLPATVLLVEDNEAHAELITRALRKHEATGDVFHVDDGEKALDYLFRRGTYTDPAKSPRPRVVLLALRLPKLDGLEVLKEIRDDKVLDGIPIVVLTSSEADRDVARAYSHRASGYLVKPIDFTHFRNMLDAACSYWLAWNHYPCAE